MKKTIIPFLLLVTIIFSAFTAVTNADWQLTDGYSIRFKGKRINGFFHSLKGEVKFDEKNLASSQVKLEVDVASIRTGNSLKSWHAKRPKWFDAKKYPTITFNSNKFQKTSSGYVVNGKLNMKGVDRDISVPFSFSNNIFYGHFFVVRTEYNVGKMKGFSKLVSDTIRIDFTIPVTK